MKDGLSVVIPALNEAEALPALLRALANQTRPPDEVIVADAGSKDGTVERAMQHGAIVVPGGRPGPGRNAGARAASGSLLFFLDADVLPGPDFVAGALHEFEEREYAVATCLIDALSDDASDRLLADATNLYLQVVQYFSPHAPGFCILVRREVHDAIGGFDEAVKLAEDHDYVQRAARQGDFGVITGVRIPVSMRRVEEEGLARLAIKYLWCEMYALAGKPIYSTPFVYEFGSHGAPDRGRLIDIGALRKQLGRIENPVQRLSEAGIVRLQDLADHEWFTGAAERFRLALDRADLDLMHDYLDRRFDLIRKGGRPVRASLTRLQESAIAESIRLDLSRLRSYLPRSGKRAADSPKLD